jgi:hypothetical protein
MNAFSSLRKQAAQELNKPLTFSLGTKTLVVSPSQKASFKPTHRQKAPFNAAVPEFIVLLVPGSCLIYSA